MNSTKKILMGIGSELQGDDGIGTIIAIEFKELNKQGWLSLPCETVPENFAGVVEREKPNLLVIVDAADMTLATGEFRLLSKENLNSAIVGTHGLPLKHLVERLEKSSEKILFIGIQPGKIKFGESISSEVETAKKKLLEIISKESWEEIKSL